jgi:Protein of unknown function (DUF2867)
LLKISESDFLLKHADCWTAQRAPGFSVVNIHMAEIAAPCERIFPELAAHDLLIPGAGWRLLFGVRAALGKLFGWDRGMRSHGPEPLEVGRHYAFFHIDHVNAPCEVGMSVKNRLTDAVMSWVVEADGAGGSRVYNITCANFHGRQGRIYWRVIRPFHDGIIEDSLEALRWRVCKVI